MQKILVIEDKVSIVRLLKRGLEQKGYEVYTAYLGKDALDIIDQHHVDLVLLDLMLPDSEDLYICEELRSRQPILPIIIISVINDVRNKVEALQSCADDYIAKPFDMAEVLARIEVQLLHSHNMRAGAEKQSLLLGPLHINFDQRRVLVNGQEVNLTYTEYKLLRILIINRRKIVTYDILLSQVWDDEGEYQSIHTYINRLRKKIEVPAQRRFIYNEPKVGYRFEADGHV